MQPQSDHAVARVTEQAVTGHAVTEHRVTVATGVELWVEERGAPDATPLLLVMGANASGLTWPDALLDRLAAHHRVIRYDHRDTGRSSRVFATAPYAIRDLADDVVRLLDALGIERAHLVGASLGGTLVQLLLLDHPDRVRSGTVYATSALWFPADGAWAGSAVLPNPDPRVLELWSHLGDERTPEQELDFRVAHWRLLHGDALPFDPAEFRELEERVAAHSGTWQPATAHALADRSGLDRAAELTRVTVPTLVVEAPADPVNPPPHAEHLASLIGSARLVTVPGMGHTTSRAVLDPLADAILGHTTAVDAAAR